MLCATSVAFSGLCLLVLQTRARSHTFREQNTLSPMTLVESAICVTLKRRMTISLTGPETEACTDASMSNHRLVRAQSIEVSSLRPVQTARARAMNSPSVAMLARHHLRERCREATALINLELRIPKSIAVTSSMQPIYALSKDIPIYKRNC
ncbi:hypothetical protein F1559_005163 [Cyanidiococcus yangmingshanensis]|uniref:Secreted protein n=1 Tax=Cyanidiococcus yangmingshanensis TaxID=2690220 RepID=A0A7J7IIB8_9RHOD|nr:hypothetical protein F1559_005163 [Cyanidiococcus yangmingshanensis]